MRPQQHPYPSKPVRASVIAAVDWLEQRCLFNTASGLFLDEYYRINPGYSESSVDVVADFNGDRRLDVVCTTESDVATNVTVYVSPGLAGGRFGDPIPTAVDHQCYVRATADLNRDGKADLLAISGNLVLALRGRGDGTFLKATSRPVGANADETVTFPAGGDTHEATVLSDKLVAGWNFGTRRIVGA